MLNTSMLELFDNIKVWNVLLFVGLIALWAVSEKRNERRRKTSLEKSQAEEQAREQKILESISQEAGNRRGSDLRRSSPLAGKGKGGLSHLDGKHIQPILPTVALLLEKRRKMELLSYPAPTTV